MIPSPRWFPTTLQDRAAWYNNFTAQLLILATALGLTGDDTDPIVEDNGVMGFLAAAAVTSDAYIDAIRDYRRVITEGDIGDPTPGFPAGITLTLPSVIPTGIFERLDNLVKRIRVAPAFTEETASLLGISTGGGGPHVPVGEVPPELKASVDPGNIIEVRFVKTNSDGIWLETNVDDGGWTYVDKFAKSPAIVNVPDNPGSTPRGVQLRARYMDGNSPVGDWSAIITVQTIP